MRKIFNEKQEKIILDNYQNMKYKDVAKLLGENYTSAQVTGWLNNNGYKKEQRNSIFTKTQQKYILDNYLTKQYKEIAKELGFTERQIRGFVNGHDKKKVRIFNEDYFKCIDDPEKAYWLGFIYADGWICYNEKNKNYEFGMELQSCDRYVLERLNFVIGNVHKVQHLHNEHYICNNENITVADSCVLRVYSKKFVNNLKSHNILERKTKKKDFPKTEIDKYFFDFLRGYIDGDGCVYVSNSSINKSCVHITSANKNILNYISEKLIKVYDIKSYVYEYKNDYGTNISRIYISGDNGLKLLNFIYYDENIFKLDRKYQKYLDYKKQGSPS